MGTFQARIQCSRPTLIEIPLPANIIIESGAGWNQLATGRLVLSSRFTFSATNNGSLRPGFCFNHTCYKKGPDEWMKPRTWRYTSGNTATSSIPARSSMVMNNIKSPLEVRLRCPLWRIPATVTRWPTRPAASTVEIAPDAEICSTTNSRGCASRPIPKSSCWAATFCSSVQSSSLDASLNFPWRVYLANTHPPDSDTRKGSAARIASLHFANAAELQGSFQSLRTLRLVPGLQPPGCADLRGSGNPPAK